MPPAKSPEAELGRRIRAARVYAGLTRSELAAILHLSEATVKRYENGRHMPRQQWRQDALIAAIAEACHLAPDWFTATWNGSGAPKR